jgi:serine palmitoyltransferase
VDHQRLSGPGYCFSAAAPPFLSAAATCALAELKANPSLVKKLGVVADKLRAGLNEIPGIYLKSKVGTEHSSPSLHYGVDATDFGNITKEQEKQVIMELCNAAAVLGVGITSEKFSINDTSGKEVLAPAFRVCAQASLTDAEIATVVQNIGRAVEETFNLVNKARKRGRTSSSDLVNMGGGGGGDGSRKGEEHEMLNLKAKSATSPFKNFFSKS